MPQRRRASFCAQNASTRLISRTAQQRVLSVEACSPTMSGIDAVIACPCDRQLPEQRRKLLEIRAAGERIEIPNQLLSLGTLSRGQTQGGWVPLADMSRLYKGCQRHADNEPRPSGSGLP